MLKFKLGDPDITFNLPDAKAYINIPDLRLELDEDYYDIKFEEIEAIYKLMLAIKNHYTLETDSEGYIKEMCYA